MQNTEYALIVDDEDDVRDLAQAAFHDLGYTTKEARNIESLKVVLKEMAARGDKMAVAVIDMDFDRKFGKFAGKEVPAIIKNILGYEVPIIIQSGSYLLDGESDIEGQTRKDGFAGRIEKPWRIPQMKEKINHILYESSIPENAERLMPSGTISVLAK